MLAFRTEKGLRCQMCGTAEWEWDPKQGGRKHAYEPVAVTCRGCQLREMAQQDNDHQPGVSVELRPTGTQQWAAQYLRRLRRERRRRQERREEAADERARRKRRGYS